MVLAIRTQARSRMNEIYQSWLSMQCQMLHGVSRAVIVLGASSGDRVETIAVWPEGGDGGSSLQAAAARAAISRKRVVESGETSSGGAEIIAAPLFREDRLLGVIAVEMGGDDADQIKVVAKMFKIGAAWLEVMISQRQTANSERLAGVVQLLAHCLERYAHVRTKLLLTDAEERQLAFYAAQGFTNARELGLNAFLRMN